MTERPDTGTRIMVATIMMIVILSYISAGEGIWAFAHRPLP
ncbi:hypothetical protein ACLBKU_11880 [Erythrobacter sp. NE805]